MTSNNQTIIDQKVEEAVDIVRPEAKEYLEMLLPENEGIVTTKDNYGRVLGFLSKLEGEIAPLFLIALVREGYPRDTALQLVTLFQWPVSVRHAINTTPKSEIHSHNPVN